VTQEQKEKVAQKRPQEAQDAPQKDVRNQELTESVDDSLAAIEEVLEDQADDELLADMDDLLGTEEEARDTVANFVQQGGE
jgi:hypothetical protein